MLRARNAAAESRSGEATPGVSEFRKLLGSKLSILYSIEGDPEYPFSEVVGVLQRVSETAGGCDLFVRRKSGDLVTVGSASIIRFKVVPAPGEKQSD